MVTISNIQHFSVGDGPGIRTTVFFKGCHLRCPWCHNPENLSPRPTVLRYGDREEIRGREVAAEALLPELLEDREFFEESGGGVTFSGGEVLLQAKEAARLARCLREAGVSVLVDTAGSVPWQAFAQIDPYVTGYLYDIKTADPEKYRVIGGDRELVFSNLERLLQKGKRVEIRIPLIPGFNTAREDVAAICLALQELGIRAVTLLPFHRLGSGKYKAMGLHYAYAQCPPLTSAQLQELEEQYGRSFAVKTEK